MRPPGFAHYIALLFVSVLGVLFLHIPLHIVIFGNVAFLVLVNHKFLKVAVQTAPRDYKGIKTLVNIQYTLAKHKRDNAAISDLFEHHVRKHGGQKEAFVDLETGRTWSFEQADHFANEIANHFAEKGFKKGDVVALFMHNCPEYVCIWLGLSKLGVVVAMINYNLKSEPLGHSIEISNAKAMIVGSDLLPVIAEAMGEGHVTRNVPVYSYDAQTPAAAQLHHTDFPVKSLVAEISKASKSKPNVEEKPGFRDVLFYIYTSGTTGLPKAAIITHCRYMMMACGAFHSFSLKKDDRIYVFMPLYHSAAGVLGAGQALLHGCTIVIRKKFSASKFWEDCKKFNCTASQYIGEICRYLLAQPPKPSDRDHNVRVMFGNGLRQQIWQQFVDRFGLKQIGEFYGSTEGNASLLNLDSHVGSCGFLPIYPILRPLYPICLLKVDSETGDLVRGEKGLCVPCRPGESGEIIGRIVKGDPLKDFVGYVSGKDTNKKIIRNVFQAGDAAFASGDILYMDELGYLYFKDRTGDTFRWKGENVSTNEVEGVVHKAVGMGDAVVYGVEIPANEGKAGMAAIVDENQNIDFAHFEQVLKEKLPPYARPVFLRFCKKVDRTGTYKLKKTDYQRAGFNPRQVNGDRLFFMNNKTGHYEPMTNEAYEAINKGLISF